MVKNRFIFLLTLLLMCILIPLQRAAASITVEVIGDSQKTTTTDHTESIKYKLRFSNTDSTADLLLVITFETSPESLTPLASSEVIQLTGIVSEDVTITIPREELSSVGTYTVTVIATFLLNPAITTQTTITTIVTLPNDIALFVVGSLEKNSTTNDTRDITYTLLVTNISSIPSLTVDLTVSGDIPAAAVNPASIELAPNAPQEITLTLPRNVLTRAGSYVTTVTATSESGISITVTVKTTINVPRTNAISFKGVGSLTRTITKTVTSDVTYTLRVTNTGNTLDLINLTVSGDVDTATLDTTSVVLDPNTYEDVTLTIPHAVLSDERTYNVTVTATSDNDPTVTAVVTTKTIIAVDTHTPTQPTLPDLSTDKVVFSEFMFESVGGENGLPQWIEVYNSSTRDINLRGWKLDWKRLQPSLLEVTTTFKEDFTIPVQQSRLIVTSLGRHSRGGKLSDDDVYQLHLLHAEELAQNDIENRNRLIDRGGFSLKLTDPKDVLIDHIGTLTGDKQTWQLHECLVDGVRSSLIRRFDAGVPRSGTERRGWRRAIDAKRLVAGIYYGHQHDLGTPAYRRGKPLPVELSQFSARFVKDEVVINWTTESELNNAGFNILRSTSQTKNFRPINTKLIQGAGTTGERRTYQFIDKTAKPNVAYYYRIEDIDLSGTPGILATYQLRGVISPTGKHITTWGTLKDKR